jgi:alpha-1,2-mannosyltransferase
MYVTVALQLAVVAGFAIVYRPFDLQIYLWGGEAVTHGLRLYLAQSHANFFTYPPFAAALFTPFAVLPPVVVGVVWELGSVVAFAAACVLTLWLAGYRPNLTIVLAMVAGGLLLEPVYHTLYLGQVNLFLLAMVLADIWCVARGKQSGLGIGIATAIKLTPGIFIVLLLLSRRARDAKTAVVTFICCTLVGFAVDPSASRLYWTHVFYDTGRVSAAYISNQSPYAVEVRMLGGASHVGMWFDLVPVIVGGIGLVVATVLVRRNDWLGAAAVTGIAGLMVSPISWTHHWVWVLPALVVMWRGGTRSRIAAACAYVLFCVAPMWWTPHAGAGGDFGWHGLVTVTANCFLIAGLAFLVYMAVSTWRTREGHHGTDNASADTRDADTRDADTRSADTRDADTRDADTRSADTPREYLPAIEAPTADWVVSGAGGSQPGWLPEEDAGAPERRNLARTPGMQRRADAAGSGVLAKPRATADGVPRDHLRQR